MSSFRSIAMVVATLVLSLGPARSWASPPNPTDSDGDQNTAGGTGTLISPVLTGGNNTGFGVSVMRFDNTGSFNTAVGAFSLAFNSGGNGNTAVGYLALENYDVGEDNTAVGTGAITGPFSFFGLPSGSNNTAIGARALNVNDTGNLNVADGVEALRDNNTGGSNTAIGAGAMTSNTTGIGNTAVGEFALIGNKKGNANIALGAAAGSELTNGNDNIYIANVGVAKESKIIRIGSDQKHTFIAGIAGRPVSGTTVVIDGDGRLGVFASSARYKRDIRDMGNGSQRLLDLRPVTFRYKEDSSGERQYGLIAEEVAKVYPELVVRGRDGAVQSVKYEELIPMLLNEVERQRDALAQMKAREDAQRETDELLAARLTRLEGAAAVGTIARN